MTSAEFRIYYRRFSKCKGDLARCPVFYAAFGDLLTFSSGLAFRFRCSCATWLLYAATNVLMILSSIAAEKLNSCNLALPFAILRRIVRSSAPSIVQIHSDKGTFPLDPILPRLCPSSSASHCSCQPHHRRHRLHPFPHSPRLQSANPSLLPLRLRLFLTDQISYPVRPFLGY